MVVSKNVKVMDGVRTDCYMTFLFVLHKRNNTPRYQKVSVLFEKDLPFWGYYKIEREERP